MDTAGSLYLLPLCGIHLPQSHSPGNAASGKQTALVRLKDKSPQRTFFRTSLKATNKKEDVSANDTSSFYSENSTLDFCLSWTLSALCFFSLLCGISCPPERGKRQRQFPVHSCDVVSPAAGIPVPNARYSCSRHLVLLFPTGRYSCSRHLVLLFPTGREFCSQSVGTIPCSPWNGADSILHASH